jgi:hypothetical protein
MQKESKMNKALFPLVVTMFLVLFLSTACAEQGQDDEAVAKPGALTAQAVTDAVVDEAPENSDSLMDQPVDFSSPEAVEETLQNIRDQEGEAAYKNLNSAMAYLLYYDLGLRNDKAKLHAKLDGQTPRQIIAKMQKR